MIKGKYRSHTGLWDGSRVGPSRWVMSLVLGLAMGRSMDFKIGPRSSPYYLGLGSSLGSLGHGPGFGPGQAMNRGLFDDPYTKQKGCSEYLKSDANNTFRDIEF